MTIVSFVIVAYNAEKYLDYSLKSLASQIYPHEYIEVIFVDGLSNDMTKQRMIEFKSLHSDFRRIEIFDNPGRYLACGWNVALKECTGDVILRVDAHTLFPDDFITQNVNIIKKGECICGGKVLSILQKDTEWNRTLLAAENSMFGGGFTFFRRGETEKYTNTLAFASYKKDVFDTVGTYNEKLVRTEDNEMHYRMRKAGYRFFFYPNIVSYRFNRSSLKGLLKQKFLNGYWVGLTHAIEPMAFSVFYLVPLFLFLSIVLFLLISYWTPIPFITLSILYILILLLSLLGAIKARGLHYTLIALPFIIFGLHIAYGVGTAKGLCEEDYKMSSSRLSALYNKIPRGVRFVYWLVEIILLPFKSIIWALKLLI